MCRCIYIYNTVSLRIIKIQTSNMKPSKPTCAHLGAQMSWPSIVPG